MVKMGKRKKHNAASTTTTTAINAAGDDAMPSTSRQSKRMKKDDPIKDKISHFQMKEEDDFEDSLLEQECDPRDLLNGTVDDEDFAALVPEEVEESIWSKEDLKTLITQVKGAITDSNVVVKFSTALEKLNWDKVIFNNYTVDDCKLALGRIFNKVRKYRTLSELLVDAQLNLDRPPTKRSLRVLHPDMPKQPISPFFKFFKSHLTELRQEHGNIPLAQLSQIASTKYNALPEKRRNKDKQKYAQEFREYRKCFNDFKEQHPELFPSKLSKESSKPKDPIDRPQKPFELYYAAKAKNYDSSDKKALMDELRRKYNGLKEKKKMKWVRRAIKDMERYKAEVAEYVKANPGYEPKVFKKEFLSKAERKLKYKLEGRPEKPPTNGYALYSKIMLSQITDVPAHEKMVLIAKRWKEMSQENREEYYRVAEKGMEEYNKEFSAYLERLPEDEREEAIQSTKRSKDKASSNAKKNGRADSLDSLANTARMAYQFQEMPKLQAKFPRFSKTEIMQMIHENWEKLAADEKKRYHDMVESFNQFSSEKKSTVKSQPKATPMSKQAMAEFEAITGLKKPTRNGFSFFTKDYFAMYHFRDDLGPKERMVKAGEAWRALKEDERKKYSDKARNNFETFQAKLDQYKKDTVI